jgi:hypothetical protein
LCRGCRSWCVGFWRRGIAGSWSRVWWGWGIDARAYQQKQIDEQDGDENEATDEDVRPESEHCLVLGKVRRWDVLVLMVAFVVMFVHADKLSWKLSAVAHGLKRL